MARSGDPTAALERLDDSCASALPGLVSALPRYLDADQALAYVLAPVEPTALDRCHALGPRPGFEQRFRAFIARAPRRFAAYDPHRPEPWQRNRPLRRADFPAPGHLDRLPFFREVIIPEGLGRHFLRVLVCDGPVLLGWVGAFRDDPFSPRERRLLAALVPALRCRLRFERAASSNALRAAALPAILDAIGDPAFLLGPHGEVREANRLGEALLRRRGPRLRAALRSAARGDAAEGLTVQRITSSGKPATLAVRCTDPEDIGDRALRMALRHDLSPAHERVLARLVRGEGNRAIARRLGLAEGTVELYVGRILERTGAENRSALIARFFEEA